MTRWLFWLPVTGCVGEGDPVEDWQLQSFVDEGEVCFTTGTTGVDVMVLLNECLSSSCSRGFEGSCAATVAGTAITLTSDLSWEQNVAEGATCTDDCGIPQADCTIDGLADGTYEVTYGDQTLTLTIPVEASEGCGPF